MKIKISLISIFLFIMSFTVLFSEEKPASHDNFIGLSASSISGTGLSYSRAFASDYMIKLCGIYYENRDKKTDDWNPQLKAYNKTKWWNTGAELQKNIYTFHPGKIVEMDVYGLMGGSYWYNHKERPFCPEDNKLQKHYTAGAGLGFRLELANRFSANVDLGYQYSNWINDERKYVGIAGGIGLNFLF